MTHLATKVSGVTMPTTVWLRTAAALAAPADLLPPPPGSVRETERNRFVKRAQFVVTS